MSGTTPRHPTHAIVVALVNPGVVASAIRVLVPGGTTLLGERGEALLGLRARALASDHSRGVPLRRAVTQASDLLDDRLRRANGGRARGKDVRDGRVDRHIERRLALDDLVHEPDPLCAKSVKPTTAGEQRSRMGFADLGDDERS